MKIDRLFTIVYILLHKPTVTAKELAEEFEVTTRTIYRDIDTLSLAGVPVYTTPGKGGGIGLLENFVLDKSLLTKDDQDRILVGLENALGASNLHSNDTLKKLKLLFHRPSSNWIEVDYSGWNNSTVYQKKFDTLKEAILQGKQVEFSYYGKTGLSKRYVKPTKLVFKYNAWYLQGYCFDKEAYRTFKLNRIQELALDVSDNLNAPSPQSAGVTKKASAPTSATLVATDTTPPPPASATLWNDTEDSSEPIVLRFLSSVAYRVHDEFDITTAQEHADGSYTITLSLPIDNWVVGYILSFGDAVEVLEPAYLRELVATSAKSIAALY